PIWSTMVDGVEVSSAVKPGEGPGRGSSPDTSMWLPCGLKVDPFPVAGLIQFEWYVPVDERSHMYFVTWGKQATTEAEIRAFQQEIDGHWRRLVVDTFNVDDVIA